MRGVQVNGACVWHSIDPKHRRSNLRRDQHTNSMSIRRITSILIDDDFRYVLFVRLASTQRLRVSDRISTHNQNQNHRVTPVRSSPEKITRNRFVVNFPFNKSISIHQCFPVNKHTRANNNMQVTLTSFWPSQNDFRFYCLFPTHTHSNRRTLNTISFNFNE